MKAYYGKDGSFRGYKEGNKYYDAHGTYRGCYVHSTGKFYGAKGEYKGKVQQDGCITKFYDETGTYMGYRNNIDGKRYGATGEYKGKREKDGRIYGPQGEYRGRSVVRGGKSKKGGGIFGFFKKLFGSR